MIQYRHYIMIASLFFALSLGSCSTVSSVSNAVGGAFKGNTKRDPQNYTLENKKLYRKYKYLKKTKAKEKEKEILKRINSSKVHTKDL